jgi:hypothetical protein
LDALGAQLRHVGRARGHVGRTVARGYIRALAFSIARYISESRRDGWPAARRLFVADAPRGQAAAAIVPVHDPCSRSLMD